MGKSVMIAHILHLEKVSSSWVRQPGNVFYLHHSAKQETINPAAPPTGVVDITQAQWFFFFPFFYLNLSIVSTDELFLCKTF